MVATTGDAPVKTVASHSGIHLPFACHILLDLLILSTTTTTTTTQLEAILYKNSMIVFGGTGFPFGDDLTNDMYVLNLSTFEWKKHEIFGNAPMKLYGSVRENSTSFASLHSHYSFLSNRLLDFANRALPSSTITCMCCVARAWPGTAPTCTGST